MENTLVWCKTKAQLDAVLIEAKKRGYAIDSPISMADMFWSNHHEETVVNLNGNGRSITYCYKDWYINHPNFGKIITADKFFDRKPILITRKGRIVTAENKNTGEKAIATCSPDDTYDFHTGALIAVARLVAKDSGISGDAETVLRKMLGDDVNNDAPAKRVYTDDDRNFTVDDRVVVRDWNDMAKEYNVKDGCISPDGFSTCFTTQMKHLCGRTATITSVDGNYVRVKFDDESGDTNWYYIRWMFNPIDSDKSTTKFKVGDLVTLKNGLEPGKTYGDMTLYHGDVFDSINGKPKKVIEVWKRSKNSPSYRTEDDWYYSEEMLEAWDENKIREGDIVKVINTGLNYSSYPQWVGKHISDPDMAARYCFGSPSDEGNYKVIKIAEHESNGRTLAYIEQCEGFIFNKCYLVEVKGLEKVTK